MQATVVQEHLLFRSSIHIAHFAGQFSLARFILAAIDGLS
jgi:hypothetical protein